jgi:hypothetical protein
MATTSEAACSLLQYGAVGNGTIWSEEGFSYATHTFDSMANTGKPATTPGSTSTLIIFDLVESLFPFASTPQTLRLA